MALQATPALASREGAALGEAFVLVAGAALVLIIVLMVAGGVIGANRFRQKGQSVLKGSAIGVLTGIGAFFVMGLFASVALTIVSGLWMAYSMFVAP